MPVTADPPKSTGTRSGVRWLIASRTRFRFDPIFFASDSISFTTFIGALPLFPPLAFFLTRARSSPCRRDVRIGARAQPADRASRTEALATPCRCARATAPLAGEREPALAPARVEKRDCGLPRGRRPVVRVRL